MVISGKQAENNRKVTLDPAQKSQRITPLTSNVAVLNNDEAVENVTAEKNEKNDNNLNTEVSTILYNCYFEAIYCQLLL